MNKIDALIIGAGPTGLFTAHQLKLIGLNCEIVDNLDKIGGQCIELYPDKPIYDIPAVPECTGEELTKNLINQIEPFNIKFHLSERVDEVKKEGDNWIIKTNNGTIFQAPNVIIAGGVGSFEPRKFPVKECEKFENKSVLYSIQDKKIFVGKTVTIFGGGDSALDWAIELSKKSKVNLVHRRDDFRGAQATVDKVHKLAKDGKINLFTKSDALASGANYLSQVGWEKNLLWGERVEIDLNNKLKDLSKKKVYKNQKFWEKIGIFPKNNYNKDVLLRLIIPDLGDDQFFLVTKNFDVILDWNRSNYFALTVFLLSNEIKN